MSPVFEGGLTRWTAPSFVFQEEVEKHRSGSTLSEPKS